MLRSTTTATNSFVAKHCRRCKTLAPDDATRLNNTMRFYGLSRILDQMRDAESDAPAILSGAPFILLSHCDTCLCVDPETGLVTHLELDNCDLNLVFTFRDGVVCLQDSSTPDEFLAGQVRFEVAPVSGSVAISVHGRYISVFAWGGLGWDAYRRRAWEEFFVVPLTSARTLQARLQQGWHWKGWTHRYPGFAIDGAAFARQPVAQMPISLTGSLAADAPLTIIVARPYHRLGNNVMQNVNAVILALMLESINVQLINSASIPFAGLLQG